ncbi:MAG: hypothetical protein AB1505_34845, partial [Candidatus Latescibacterota bacterium]
MAGSMSRRHAVRTVSACLPLRRLAAPRSLGPALALLAALWLCPTPGLGQQNTAPTSRLPDTLSVPEGSILRLDLYKCFTDDITSPAGSDGLRYGHRLLPRATHLTAEYDTSQQTLQLTAKCHDEARVVERVEITAREPAPGGLETADTLAVEIVAIQSLGFPDLFLERDEWRQIPLESLVTLRPGQTMDDLCWAISEGTGYADAAAADSAGCFYSNTTHIAAEFLPPSAPTSIRVWRRNEFTGTVPLTLTVRDTLKEAPVRAAVRPWGEFVGPVYVASTARGDQAPRVTVVDTLIRDEIVVRGMADLPVTVDLSRYLEVALESRPLDARWRVLPGVDPRVVAELDGANLTVSPARGLVGTANVAVEGVEPTYQVARQTVVHLDFQAPIRLDFGSDPLVMRAGETHLGSFRANLSGWSGEPLHWAFRCTAGQDSAVRITVDSL